MTVLSSFQQTLQNRLQEQRSLSVGVNITPGSFSHEALFALLLLSLTRVKLDLRSNQLAAGGWNETLDAILESGRCEPENGRFEERVAANSPHFFHTLPGQVWDVIADWVLPQLPAQSKDLKAFISKGLHNRTSSLWNQLQSGLAAFHPIETYRPEHSDLLNCYAEGVSALQALLLRLLRHVDGDLVAMEHVRDAFAKQSGPIVQLDFFSAALADILHDLDPDVRLVMLPVQGEWALLWVNPEDERLGALEDHLASLEGDGELLDDADVWGESDFDADEPSDYSTLAEHFGVSASDILQFEINQMRFRSRETALTVAEYLLQHAQ